MFYNTKLIKLIKRLDMYNRCHSIFFNLPHHTSSTKSYLSIASKAYLMGLYALHYVGSHQRKVWLSCGTPEEAMLPTPISSRQRAAAPTVVIF